MSATSLEFSPDQTAALDAVRAWLSRGGSQVFSLGGLAGTGKSTLLGHIAKGFAPGLAAYVALTGRASAVLRQKLLAAGVETTGELRTKQTSFESSSDDAPFCGTVHRLVYRPVVDEATEEVKGFSKRTGPDRPYALVVVDEASMLSEPVLDDLCAFGAPVLLVGDHGQLGPVRAGAPIAPMQSPDVKLERIHRQAENSAIVQLAHALRQGATLQDALGPALLTGSDGQGYYGGVRLRPKETFASEWRGRALDRSCAAVCWTNKTRVRCNAILRRHLGFEASAKKGEIVVALKNEPPVYNGMRGVLEDDVAIDPRLSWRWLGKVGFPEDEIAPFRTAMCGAQFGRSEGTFKELSELADAGVDVSTMRMAGALTDYGYVLSVHKAQGSTFRHVALVLDRPSAPNDPDYRRWIYTAVTRAAETLTIFQ